MESERRVDVVNSIGPFEKKPDGVKHRHLSCANYSECLSYASFRLWDEFSCKGCRKTKGAIWK